MINFPAICIANGAAILLLLAILLNTKRPPRHGLPDEKIYFAMVAFNILQCVFESVVFWMDGKTANGYHTLLIVLNVILFVNTILFSCLWPIYVDYKLFEDVNRIKRIYTFLAIPAALTIIACLINLATPVFFVIDEYNTYQRTNLFIIPYTVNYFYLAYGMILIYSCRKRAQRYLFLPSVLFVTPIVIGTLLQFFFYGYSLIWLGVSIGMVSLFINVQIEASYVDMLSGLFNRQYLANLLLMHSKKRNNSGVTAGIMLDIDSFKSINSRFGHVVGDDAISTVGMMLRAAVGDKGVICRYGGDEFIVLMQINSQKEIMDMIDIIQTRAALFNKSGKKPYTISFSFGYSTYQSRFESIDDFLKKIDASMYEDKKRKISEKIIPDRRQHC